jgi:hypothetical protein
LRQIFRILHVPQKVKSRFYNFPLITFHQILTGNAVMLQDAFNQFEVGHGGLKEQKGLAI